MSLFRWVALVSLICIALVPLCAQDAGGDEFGFIQGVVKYTDGTPVQNAKVTMTVNGKAVTAQITTDATGTFNQMVPAGNVIVTVEGVTKTVQVVAGEQKTLAIEIKQTGVMVTVTYADKTAATGVSLNAAYKSPEGDKSGLQASQLVPGRFIFRDIPASATNLSVIARVNNGIGNKATRQLWTFTKAEELRQLSMTVDKPVKVSLLVLDANELPLANTRVNGVITYKIPPVPFWDNDRTVGGEYPNTQTLNNQTTDATGVIDLGLWASTSIEITLRSDKQAGGTVKFDIKSDGTPQQLRYALNLKPRTVTQTVFNADGKPAPNALVNISYCWLGNIVLAQTTTDTKGKAIWKDLPPVRAIVWGDGIPAGVLPADVQTVTTLLPAPVVDDNRSFQFQINITNPGTSPMRAFYVSHTGSNRGGSSGDASFTPQENAKDTDFRLGSFWAPSGCTFDLVAVVNGAQPRIATLENIYLPFVDGGNHQQNVLSLELRPATVLRGKLLTKNGPINGLNQIKIKTISQTGTSITVPASEQRRLSLLTPALQPDGSFTAILPGAGQYQLLVDLYDESTVPPADLLIDVPAAGKDVTITLPEPFLKVPPGTQVSWLTRRAPAVPRTLVAAAYGSPMPILGPSDQILAIWFRPSPDKLVIWNGLTRSQQVLPLRAAVVTVTSKTDQRPLDNLSLLPLLPNGNSYWSNDNMPRAASEIQPTSLADQGICPAIWGAKYLVPTAQAGMATRYTPIEIPVDGSRDIAVTADTNTLLPYANRRHIRLKLLQGNIEDLRKVGTERIMTTFDTAPLFNTDRYLYAWSLNGNEDFEVPTDAKTITLAWSGVGVVQDLPIPPGNGPTVEIPAWNTGVSIAGKILSADGTPCANKSITIKNCGITDNSTSIRPTTTDAQGAFTAKGLLPGMVIVFIENNGRENSYGGWIVDVPKEGVKDLTLRIAASPVRISFNGGSNLAWWFPDNGKPQMLAMFYSSCASHDAVTGPGWLWCADGYRGVAQYARINLTAGQQSLYDQNMNSGPALGLYFPLDLTKGMPGAVTLLGLDDRAKIQVRFTQMEWKPSTILNKVVAQINAVPPGKYRVLVETLSGTTEATVTITNNGGMAEFDYPAAAPAAGIAPAHQPAAAMRVD